VSLRLLYLVFLRLLNLLVLLGLRRANPQPGQPAPWWWSPLRGQVLVWIIPSGAARSRAPAAAVCDGWDEMRVRAVLVGIDPAQDRCCSDGMSGGAGCG
jgi:hypothetical protein